MPLPAQRAALADLLQHDAQAAESAKEVRRQAKKVRKQRSGDSSTKRFSAENPGLEVGTSQASGGVGPQGDTAEPETKEAAETVPKRLFPYDNGALAAQYLDTRMTDDEQFLIMVQAVRGAAERRGLPQD
ncbi:hypothetical protein ACFW9I_35940 [[Kitasatospora] papulosa]|uniref:hypothetical protein n=1 Tax=[Kitasatospora] papulosa TaxID=1464011 RepID=UPI0036751FD5